MSQNFIKGLDHPCKKTCSGWAQGRERGLADAESKIKKLEAKLGEARSFIMKVSFVAHPIAKEAGLVFEKIEDVDRG